MGSENGSFAPLGIIVILSLTLYVLGNGRARFLTQFSLSRKTGSRCTILEVDKSLMNVKMQGVKVFLISGSMRLKGRPQVFRGT